ncbi:hypothetical protein PAECIP111891_04879 [Paenibacillus allorhizoplanae]|uniref:Helix-hairpin-helix DNA-binding motif class 1 domain-containing protein n=1 Tax=Paenibacillus allorhizoplanae TaxID=2905648 RepID=A0ABM9CPU6_9BACL|nr:helix-hairpin-helix domain-containing protein [Paenibacillus allorhizoplanae]CAH1219437.1 hypothetical protein PAECIP111891_04879 [Paenibacillus allorhizoplanae]
MDLFGNKIKKIGLILGAVSLFVWVVWPFLRGGQATIQTAFMPINAQMEELLVQGENEKKAATGKAASVGNEKARVTPKASSNESSSSSEVISTPSSSTGASTQTSPPSSETHPTSAASPVPPIPALPSNEAQKRLLDLNTATLEQLDKLPGIGESKAKTILEYRMKKGRFKRVEELKDVKGIGDKMFEKLKGFIYVGPV